MMGNSLTKLYKDWKKEGVDENVVLMHMTKKRMSKPDMQGIVLNLKTGRTRKPKVGEVGLLLIDPYSDPSPSDGDLVVPKRSWIKHGKKK